MSSNESLEISIDGGLGNQLFKFYAGLYFSKEFKMELVFDISKLAIIADLHPGENIQTLGLLEGYATKTKHTSTPHELGLRLQNAYLRQKAKLKSNLSTQLVETEKFDIGYVEFSAEMNPADLKHCYFQSWRYFDGLDAKPTISLQNLSKPTTWLKEQVCLIDEINPLVFHVRRGDYLLKKNRQLGCLSLDYYLSISREVLENKEIWLFTDSPNQVLDEFKGCGLKINIIDPPLDSDPVESMILMSHSNQLIISNSTFSWWAAMFSQTGTSVYAPSKWFERRPDPKDLIPAAWERVTSRWVAEDIFRKE